MRAEWRALLCGSQFRVDGTSIEVDLHDGRRHSVQVVDGDGVWELQAIVAHRTTVDQCEDLQVRLWLMNRASELVSFRIDQRRRLVAEGWVPKPGVTRAEFQLHVHALAAEADRVEFLLTGKDKL